MKMHENIFDSLSPVCVGTGLIALDVVISSISDTSTQFLAGGSCGNVLTILSFFGWSTFPIARLNNNVAAELLLDDLKKWKVNEDLLSINETGSTPIIIHRILKDRQGVAKHRFEFKNPEDGKYLPSYKPFLAKSVSSILEKESNSNVFFFDRINRGAIELAKGYKKRNSIIFFEPSSAKDIKGFFECMEIANVVKFSEERIPDYEKFFPVAKAELEVQTLGSKGLKFRRKNDMDWYTLDGYSIDDVVDAAGAGDWCTAGIIFNLFKKKNEIENLEISEIIHSLQFGQILSALNCTYEGARGLMYNVDRNFLFNFINYIISSNIRNIDKRTSPKQYKSPSSNIRISSLFTTT